MAEHMKIFVGTPTVVGAFRTGRMAMLNMFYSDDNEQKER